MNKLANFLTDLAINPKQQLAFAKEPDAVMNTAGLSKMEQLMLKRGNFVQISTAIGNESFPYAQFFADPNPDPWPDPDPPPPDDNDEKQESSDE